MGNNKTQTINNFNEIKTDFLSYPETLIYMNIRSLRLNFTYFLATINNIIHKIKFIVLVETNISDNENNFYNIQGFNSIFLNREGRGGGIAVYIAESLTFNHITLTTNSFEIVQTDVNINKNTLSLLSVYRPPHKTIPPFINELDTFINNIKKKQNILLVGDVNIDLLRENSTTTTYLNMLTSNGLQCMVNESTREDVKRNTRTCIDRSNNFL